MAHAHHSSRYSILITVSLALIGAMNTTLPFEGGMGGAKTPGAERFEKQIAEILEKMAQKDFLVGVEQSVAAGIFAGLTSATSTLTQTALIQMVAPSLSYVKYPTNLLISWVHLCLFGAQELTWNRLVSLNNIIIDLINPLATPNAVRGDWQLRQQIIMRELLDIITILQNHSACYGPRIGASSSWSFFAGGKAIASLLSTQHRAEIHQNIAKMVDYLHETRTIVHQVSTLKDLDMHRETIKMLLQRTCKTAKHIGFLLNPEVVAEPRQYPGYLPFVEPNNTSGGQPPIPGLDALFQQPGNLPNQLH